MDPRKGRSIVRNQRIVAEESRAALELDAAFDIFYSAKKAEGIRKKSLEDEYVNNWRFFRDWLDAERPQITSADEITVTVMRDFMNYVSTRPKYSGVHKREQTDVTVSPYTVAYRIRTLRTIFNFLSNERLIPVNPVANLKEQRFDREEKETFSDDDVRRLLATPNTETYAGFRDRTLMMTLADCGLRINEAVQLTTEFLDIKGRCLNLPAWMNKNRKPRVVPISAECARELLALVTENRRYFDTDHIFVANYGEPLKADHFRKRLKQHALKAGVDKELAHPHQFRSYFITTFLLNGGDLFTLQRIVAHANIETTRGYAKVNDGHAAQQHAQFSPLARLGLTRVGKRR
ncbi:tyrosine-type recombinase/integrase [Paenibacillus sp. YIM B09110]|uniref:tyrosine-type recombinase/integrase n=1 Tax=Paenibacillus sp. YIM B09110 TaxID=3126102 RepID=UPI00301D735E